MVMRVSFGVFMKKNRDNGVSTHNVGGVLSLKCHR